MSALALVNTGFRPPVRFSPSTAAVTRAAVFSARFTSTIEVIQCRIAFELNAQRVVKVRLWMTNGATTQAVTAVAGVTSAGHVPTGRNLLAGGGSIDYVVGDGQEGEITIPLGAVGRDFNLCADIDNTDAVYAHVVDVTFDVREVT